MENPTLVGLAQLVRQSLVQEATNRTKSQQNPFSPLAAPTQSTAASDSAQPLSDGFDLVDELATLYDEERQRNDAIQTQIHAKLEQLAHLHPATSDSEIESKRIRVAKLDFELEKLSQDQMVAPPLDPLPLIDIRTRAHLYDLSTQLTDSLFSLHSQLSSDNGQLEQERQLLADLEVVEQGLFKRRQQLKAKNERDVTSASAIRELKEKQRKHDTQLQHLLEHLISTSDALFRGQDQKRFCLRLYLDRLMNRAWESPQDPWVSTSDLIHRKDATEVDVSILELFVRANIAVQHPRDTRRWRLVAFHKPTRPNA